MRFDKTLSELWYLVDDGDIGETIKMAINTIKKLQERIGELEKALDDIYSITKFSRPDLVPNEVKEIAWKALTT